jgi:hypothetical protein
MVLTLGAVGSVAWLATLVIPTIREILRQP